jgi:probable F420-dependent oxidoreductase
VVQVPGGHSDWEREADVSDLVKIAQAADRLGVHHLTCSEHVGVPEALATQRGTVYWDPAVTLALLAGCTHHLRLVTQVLVLGYHHPLALVKRYGTLDRVSGGRLVLGVGVGSLEEEFDLLAAPFADRGARADDALRALRAAWGMRVPDYHGTHYDFAGFVVEPLPVQQRVPVWVGGRTARSLRRATSLGDGWVPMALSLDQIRELVDDAAISDGFDVVLSAGRPLDPLSDPSHVEDTLHRLRAAGGTVAGVSLRSDSAEHYCDQLAALMGLAGRVN